MSHKTPRFSCPTSCIDFCSCKTQHRRNNNNMTLDFCAQIWPYGTIHSCTNFTATKHLENHAKTLNRFMFLKYVAWPTIKAIHPTFSSCTDCQNNVELSLGCVPSLFLEIGVPLLLSSFPFSSISLGKCVSSHSTQALVKKCAQPLSQDAFMHYLISKRPNPRSPKK